MSVTMAKADGVTVLTLTSDPQSTCPPLCQILKSLCYSPMLCSVSQHLKRVQKASQSVLGTLHIMVGLLNIGLGTILFIAEDAVWWEIFLNGCPYWLGGLFILFGAMCILSEKCPSPCLVTINVILNIAGVALAITAIVLYSINIARIEFWWTCGRNDDYNSPYYTPPPHNNIVEERCLQVRALALMLLRSINAVLIILSVLELCVAISSVLLGINALRSSLKRENEGTKENYETLREEVTSNSMA